MSDPAARPGRRWWRRGCALLLGSALSAAAAEVVVRVRWPDLNDPRYWAEYDAEFFRWRASVDTDQAQVDAFLEGRTFCRHDPRLGWDYGCGVRGRSTLPAEERDGRRRIVGVGDSFMYGNEVEDAEAWDALLRADGFDALNMGVGGYGVDQSCAKAWFVASRYRPDGLLIGVFEGDVVRAAVDFFGMPKPTVGAGWVLTPPGPFELQQGWRSRAWTLARGALLRRSDPVRNAQALDLTIRLLDETRRRAAAWGGRAAVVHFPEGHPSGPLNKPRDVALDALYRTRGLEVIDLGKLLGREPDPGSCWVDRGGGNRGHLSPRGHAVLARAIRTWAAR
jgi:hypothetical protein